MIRGSLRSDFFCCAPTITYGVFTQPGSNPVVEACLRHVRFTPILLQKSPRESCRIETRNNRIETNGFLNQRCACAPDVESMLLAQMRKIFLQHYRPVFD